MRVWQYEDTGLAKFYNLPELMAMFRMEEGDNALIDGEPDEGDKPPKRDRDMER